MSPRNVNNGGRAIPDQTLTRKRVLRSVSSEMMYVPIITVNNSDIIVAYDTVTVNDLAKVVIFKSGNKFNSVFSYDGLGKDEGKDIALSFSFPGTCKRKNIS